MASPPTTQPLPDPDSTRATSRLFAVGAAATLGGLLFGFDIAIITGAGPFIERQFGLSPLALGAAFSALLFGCVLGSAVAGGLADRYGRRGPLLWVAVLFAASSVATALAPSYWFLLVARFLGGIAVGAESSLTPMYVSEVSPRKSRGRMGTLYQLAIVAGIVTSYCINYALRDLGAWNWRWMFMTGALPAVLFWFMLWRIPESPRYLVLKGRSREAAAILGTWLAPAELTAEIEVIEESVSEPSSGWRELLKARYRWPLAVAFVLAILVHFSGINTIVDYAPRIFVSAGWSMDVALFSTFGIGLTMLLFTLVSFWVIDRYGRKPLYLVGSLGMMLALSGLAWIAARDDFAGAKVFWLIVAYIACFSACIGPVFWTLVPEIFPNRIRGEAVTVPVLTQWVANAVVVLLFPVAFEHVGKSATFGFLAFMAGLQALVSWRFLPETKGRSLEEIEQAWGQGNPRAAMRSKA